MVVLPSLKSALNSAIRPDVDVHFEFMPRLQSEVSEIAEALKVAYGFEPPLVNIWAHTQTPLYVSLNYFHDNFPTEGSYAAACDDADNPEDVDAHTDHIWVVEMNLDTAEFTLCYDSDNPDLDSDSCNQPDWKEETFPLTEAGYQKLICRFSKVLNRFIPLAVKIAYFQEMSRRNYQQTLDLC